MAVSNQYYRFFMIFMIYNGTLTSLFFGIRYDSTAKKKHPPVTTDDQQT